MSLFIVTLEVRWRYVREAVDLFAALSDDVRTAGERVTRLAFGILDGTLISTDRKVAVIGGVSSE